MPTFRSPAPQAATVVLLALPGLFGLACSDRSDEGLARPGLSSDTLLPSPAEAGKATIEPLRLASETEQEHRRSARSTAGAATHASLATTGQRAKEHGTAPDRSHTVQVVCRLWPDEMRRPNRNGPPFSEAMVQVGFGTRSHRHSPHLPPSPGAEHAVALVTDASGKATVTLTIPSHVERPFVWARPTSPGYVGPMATAWRLDKGESTLALMFRKGVVLEGHVVNEAGDPQDGVDVHPEYGSHTLDIDGESVTFRTVLSDGWDSVTTNAAGFFQLPVAFPGALTLRASERGLGSALLQKVTPDALESPVLLTLRGDGRLTGTLRRPDGTPLSVMCIEARHESRTGIPSERIRGRYEDGNGRMGDQVFTDTSGRFELTGLVPGNYDLVVPRSLAPPLEVTPNSASTGDDFLDLVVTDLHILRARLLDHLGQPVQLGYSTRIKPSEPPGMECIRVPSLDPGIEEHLWAVRGTATRANERTYIVEAGRDYVISIVGHGIPPLERRVPVALANVETEIEFRLPPPAPLGLLEARLVSRGEDPPWTAELELLTTEGKRLLHRSSSKSGPPTLRCSLSPGEYLLREGTKNLGWACGTGRLEREPSFSPSFPKAPPAERLITIVSGVTNRFDLELPRFGSLQVQLEESGVPIPQDRRFVTHGGRQTELSAWTEKIGAVVELRNEVGRLLPHTDAWSVVERPGEPPAIHFRHLPDGTYTVLVTTAEGRSARVTKTVRGNAHAKARMSSWSP